MNKKVIYIDNLKGLKQAEKMQILGWIPLHNGFFNPYLTMIKGTEKETTDYKNKYYKQKGYKMKLINNILFVIGFVLIFSNPIIFVLIGIIILLLTFIIDDGTLYYK